MPLPFRQHAAQRISALVLLIACCFVHATGQAAHLWTGQSRYYLIHTDLNEEQVATWADHMDSVYAGYSELLKSFPNRSGNQKQNLYLLKDRDSYLATLKTFDFDGAGSGGMFFVSPRGSGLITYVGDQSSRQIQGVLQHEGFHQFAYSRIGRTLPIWVNEGLAEYFEQAIVVDGKIKHGLATRGRVEAIKHALATDNIIPFNGLLDTTNEEWSERVRQGGAASRMQYLQSWSVVHFLIHGDKAKYQQPFDRYLRLLADGKAHSQAFAAAFGTDNRDAFRKRWEAFVKTQLQVDPITEAIDRLTFLSECTLLLIKQIGQTDIQADQLFAQLQAYGFETRAVSTNVGTHPGLSTRDDAVFTYTNDRGYAQSFKPRKNTTRGLPPTIAAEGLHPSPTVLWSSQDGKLSYKVVYRKR